MGMVEVTQGEECVLLPFVTEDRTFRDVKVEWKHNQKRVHVYKHGKNQPDKQDQDYKDRTEMNEETLRTGDFSLKLKEPRLSDRGGYTCTIYSKGGKILLQKVVSVSVRGEWNSFVLEEMIANLLPSRGQTSLLCNL